MTDAAPSAELATFSPYVGDGFEVVDPHTQGTAFALELVDATPLPFGQPGYREPFSLTFSGPAVAGLAQGTYTFRHHVIGELPIFLVPISESNDTRRYEAIFN
ncbi:MAG: DUF6916 family protein [Fimbriimonadaceae bacterium]